MSYIKIEDDLIIEISCTPEEATKQGLKQLPSNFKRASFYPHKISSYNEDLTPKTESQLIEDGIISDNKGTYYDTITKQKIIIDKLNIDKPENVTELKPLNNFCTWDGIKWEYDIESIKDNKITQVKSQANSIIIAKYPMWKQNNLQARYTELVDKLVDGETLTTEEATEKETIKSVWSWVKDIRVQSDAKESEINLLTTIEELENYEITYNI